MMLCQRKAHTARHVLPRFNFQIDSATVVPVKSTRLKFGELQTSIQCTTDPFLVKHMTCNKTLAMYARHNMYVYRPLFPA